MLYQQPQFGAQIDWSNPITRGLVFLQIGADFSDLVSGLQGAPNSISRVVGTPGRGLSSGYLAYANRSSHDLTGTLTCFSLAAASSTSSDALTFGKVTSNGAGDTPFAFGMNSGGNVYLNRATSGSGAGSLRIWKSTETPFTTLNTPIAIAVRQAADISATPEFFANGTKLGTTLQFGSGAGAATASANGVWVGRRQDGGLQWPGAIYVNAAWNRALSDAEIKSLSANPWQLFADPVDQLTLVVAAAGGPVTLVIQDALQAQLADNLTLTTAVTLSVDPAAHAQLADAPTLTSAQVLAVADALHAQIADNLDLLGVAALTISDAAHAQLADGLTINTAAWLAIADALHAQLADSVGLTGGDIIVGQAGLTVYLRRRRR